MKIEEAIKRSEMKAYKAWIDDGEGSTVVFAETRNKAKVIAMYCDCCEGAKYAEICIRRMKGLDSLYKGRSEIDWYDHETRLVLVRDYGWRCLEPYHPECEICLAKKHCSYWES